MSRGEKKRKRPRGESETRQQGTLELALTLVECSRDLDQILRARWWQRLFSFRSRAEDINSLRTRIYEVSAELGLRYKGVMSQLLQRMQSGEDFRLAVARTWEYVGEVAVTMADPKEFCSYLWHAFVGTERQSKAQSLKPKFMLRQFVDEVPSCKDLGVLIAMAYGPTVSVSLSSDEILNCLSHTYPLLHFELERRSPDLLVLTDGEISSATIPKIVAPFVQYETWLFNC